MDISYFKGKRNQNAGFSNEIPAITNII